MNNEAPCPEHAALLVLPRVRVQNANAISSPMTWGFPAMSAFTGLMAALERRLGADAGIAFFGVGVVCNDFEAQVTSNGYTRAFHLTRNPVMADGGTAAIVEEGRVHMEVTLVFDVLLSDAHRSKDELLALAERISDLLAGMRIAGGSVMPSLPGMRRPAPGPALELVPELEDEKRKQFRRLARQWLPGFALVSRDDLLQARLAELRNTEPETTLLGAWLDLSRWNRRAVQRPARPNEDGETVTEWITDTRQGWTVPIPVGFAAISDLYEAGSVAGARDTTTAFRFVESVWSMGQWISPHRLNKLTELVWFSHYDRGTSLYSCRNEYITQALAIPAHN